MTPRERMLALMRGCPQDRVPFVQYDDNLSFPKRREVQEHVGAENIGFLQWVTSHRFETPNCQFATEAIERNGLQG